MRDELSTLVQLARIRNALLMATVTDTELRRAAARVVRLSRSGTPERLLTLIAVAQETGLATTALVDEIVRFKETPPPPEPPP